MSKGTVLVSPKYRSRRRGSYHTDEDCRYVGDHHVEKDRGMLPDYYDVCSVCAGTAMTENQNHRRSLRHMVETGEIDA